MIRTIELTAGALAGLAALADGVYASIFGISESTLCTDAGRCVISGNDPWQQEPGTAVSWILFSAIAGAILFGLPYLHAEWEDTYPLVMLWIVAVLLAAACMLGALSLLLIGPALFTLVAAAIGTVAQVQYARTNRGV